MSIGVEFIRKIVQLEGKALTVQLFNITGSERFARMRSSWYRGVQGMMLMYSVANRKSFESLPQYIEEANQHLQEEVPRVLIANKVDIVDGRDVTEQEGTSVM